MIDVQIVPIIPHNQNYAYILKAENGEIAVVDPGEAAPLIEALEAEGLEPDFILLTHHHWDHVDGVEDLLAHYGDCRVAGPSKEVGRIKTMHILLDEFSVFQFGGEDVQILETPGHTTGHICYFFPESKILLAGDTLFSMGCGRLFEGTPAQMWESLCKIAALPDETQIYCGHEYTLANGAFCAGIEPDNAAIKARLEDVRRLRDQGRPTLPVTLKTEKETNAFLRAGSADNFAKIRALKDRA